jgi:hypothetical protein
MLNWMVKHGADLIVADSDPANLILDADDGRLLRLADNLTFDSVAASAPDLERRLAQREASQSVKVPRLEVGARPVFAFKTREGGLGVLQVLGFAEKQREVKIRYKLVPRSTAQTGTVQPNSAVPGLVIERVIEATGTKHRALNLGTGNFMEASRGRELVFRADHAEALRVAGVDLYAADDALAKDNLNTLDMRLWVGLFPQGTNSPSPDLDAITTSEFALLMVYARRVQATMEEGGVFGGPVGFDLRKVEPVLRGTGLHLFITREGTEGVVQIAGVTDNPPGVKVRYRLLGGGRP